LSAITFAPPVQPGSLKASIQQQISPVVDELIGQLPSAERLTLEQGRAIIARYSAVLEGNFIYWMTATFIAVQSEEAREIIMENLHEEVRDSHPAMLRRFAVAANSFPTQTDALAVDEELTRVRLFMGKLQAVPSLFAMAFFEGFIQRFMDYLANLAAAQGSVERVYTDVHGVCDIAHSQELFRAIALEMERNPPGDGVDLFEGVNLLRALIHTIIHGSSSAPANGRV
jgi:Iron-containing redox enzyme